MTPDLSTLQDDGDKLEIPGGELRLVVETDTDTDINDFDCYGKVQWQADNDFGHVRPESFTGRARILNRDRIASLWWEPYEELTPEQIVKEEPRIRELIEYGFKVVGLQFFAPSYNADGEEVGTYEVSSAYLGGMDSVDDLTDLLPGLYSELETPEMENN